MVHKPKIKKSRKKYVYAVGRRKTATAQVRLYSGKGETEVNQLPIGQYFLGESAKLAYQLPFQVTNTLNKYYATVLVKGSGKISQLKAVVHGLARALDKAEGQESCRQSLKKHRLLTRDSRRRERRKPGQMGRARKKKQSPKR